MSAFSNALKSLNLPPFSNEVLDIIFKECTPRSLLMIQKTCKLFNELLTTGLASDAWVIARKRVGLPDIPAGIIGWRNLTEPAYAQYVFGGGLCALCSSETVAYPSLSIGFLLGFRLCHYPCESTYRGSLTQSTFEGFTVRSSSLITSFPLTREQHSNFNHYRYVKHTVSARQDAEGHTSFVRTFASASLVEAREATERAMLNTQRAERGEPYQGHTSASLRKVRQQSVDNLNKLRGMAELYELWFKNNKKLDWAFKKNTKHFVVWANKRKVEMPQDKLLAAPLIRECIIAYSLVQELVPPRDVRDIIGRAVEAESPDVYEQLLLSQDEGSRKASGATNQGNPVATASKQATVERLNKNNRPAPVWEKKTLVCSQCVPYCKRKFDKRGLEEYTRHKHAS